MPLSIVGMRAAKSISKVSSPMRSRSESPNLQSDPALILKICILKAKDLTARDKDCLNEPYVTLLLEDYNVSTQAVPKTANPEWNAVFEIPLYRNQSSFTVQGTVWNKDRFRKQYIGSFDLSLPELFTESSSVVETSQNNPFWINLYSTHRKQTTSRGSVYIRLILQDPTDHMLANNSLLSKFKDLITSEILPLTADVTTSGEEDTNSHSDSSDMESQPDYETERYGLSDRREAVTIKNDIKYLPVPRTKRRSRLRFRRRRRHMPYSLRTGDDIMGLLFFEVIKVTDLPPERNVTRTGFDMDPFVVVSFGKKVVRTGVQRHSLNPQYNEKMLFPIMRHETGYSLLMTVIDKDKLSNNDFVASATIRLNEVLEDEPSIDPETGLYVLREFYEENSSKNVLDRAMKSFKVPLILKNTSKWEDKHSPFIDVRMKYVPYAALRQQFWRFMLKQYDDGDDGNLSRYELSAFLEAIGSTLREPTIDGFFERYGKTIDEDLKLDEIIICLEDEIYRESRDRSSSSDASPFASSDNVSLMSVSDYSEYSSGVKDLTSLTISGYPKSDTSLINAPSDHLHEKNSSIATTSYNRDENDNYILNPEDIFYYDIENTAEERVMTINECPVCHLPRLHKKSEVDIITHLATCATQDWRSINIANMRSYVTSAQAGRKWFSKVVSKVTYGGYRLGANSANILVQDRTTGYISEERMSMYVRLGIRLLYKGLKSREMERKKIRKILASLSYKQGKKYDDAKSVKSIRPFIAFHQLDMSDVLKTVEEFKTFNEFFYRQLRPDARPCAAKDQPKIIVSPADCRSVFFEKIDDATKIWVKGREFSLQRLFGSAYPEEVTTFRGGAMAIFRLAPQDYHRFHIPVDGILGSYRTIEGAYYTVNPMAIRSALDVYGENVRVLVPIYSKYFGTVMIVCVGAMMVGSTIITAKEGTPVSRTEELGYFKFGGSTLLMFFEQGRAVFDSDLIANSKQSLETLIRVGMSIGHTPDIPEWRSSMSDT
ncbi:phosphatidylserine decarboxylase-domain-containing protein [Dipodascopsis uninucleata]